MSRPCYSFKNFELDPAGRELREAGIPVELPASAFDCLVYLIEHRDRAVSRDELISATWGCVGTSETTLAHTVVRLRRLFGDAGKEQHTIRTIARVGFRWVATTSEHAAPAPSPRVATTSLLPAELSSPPQAAAIARRRPSRLFLAAVCLIATAAMAGTLLPGRSAAVRVGASASIVLPADTGSLPSEWAWLRFSVADLVAARLSRSRFAAMPSERIATASDRPNETPANVPDARSLQIQPEVTRVDAQWRVVLHARDAHGRQFLGEGRGADALDAARRASDVLLDSMGYATLATGSLTAVPSDAEARLDAALAGAMAAAALERYDEAADRLGEARTLGEHSTDGNAKVDVAFGALLLHRQQPAMALPYLHRAIARLEHAQGSRVLIDALTKVAQAQLSLRANDAALVAASQAWSLTDAHGEVSMAAEMQARALAASGNPEGARRLADGLQAHAPLERARLHAMHAWLALADDDAGAAVDAATQALTLEFARADRPGYARAWIDKIQALQRLGRSHQSSAELQRFTRWCETACASTQALRRSLLASQAMAEQRPEDALALHADALRAADRTATPATQTAVAAAYLEALVAAGRMDAAVAVAGRLPERDLAVLAPHARTAVGAVRTWQEQFLQQPALASAPDERRRRRRGDIAR